MKYTPMFSSIRTDSFHNCSGDYFPNIYNEINQLRLKTITFHDDFNTVIAQEGFLEKTKDIILRIIRWIWDKIKALGSFIKKISLKIFEAIKKLTSKVLSLFSSKNKNDEAINSLSDEEYSNRKDTLYQYLTTETMFYVPPRDMASIIFIIQKYRKHLDAYIRAKYAGDDIFSIAKKASGNEDISFLLEIHDLKLIDLDTLSPPIRDVILGKSNVLPKIAIYDYIKMDIDGIKNSTKENGFKCLSRFTDKLVKSFEEIQKEFNNWYDLILKSLDALDPNNANRQISELIKTFNPDNAPVSDEVIQNFKSMYIAATKPLYLFSTLYKTALMHLTITYANIIKKVEAIFNINLSANNQQQLVAKYNTEISKYLNMLRPQEVINGIPCYLTQEIENLTAKLYHPNAIPETLANIFANKYIPFILELPNVSQDIIVFDSLLKSILNHDELMCVLYHEYGHIYAKHTLFNAVKLVQAFNNKKIVKFPKIPDSLKIAQALEADAIAISNGCKPSHIVTALKKLAAATNMSKTNSPSSNIWIRIDTWSDPNKTKEVLKKFNVR